MNEQQTEKLYELTKQQITAFAEKLSPDEKVKLAQIDGALFAKIWQAAMVATLDVAQELRK